MGVVDTIVNIKIDKADKYFSLYIRERDNNTCQRCFGTKGLQCSHFQGRRKEATRFDPLNADTLCMGCHMYFTANPAEHCMWQVQRKGQNEINSIIVRSNSYCKKDRSLQALIWKKAYSDLCNEKKLVNA